MNRLDFILTEGGGVAISWTFVFVELETLLCGVDLWAEFTLENFVGFVRFLGKKTINGGGK